MNIHIQTRVAGKCTGSVCVCICVCVCLRVCVNSEFISVRISTD